LPAEMIEDPRRNELHGVERSAGHFEEPDLQSEGQSVQGAPPLPNRSKFVRVEREEMLDLECRQRLGKPFFAEISILPPMGRRLFRRAGYRMRNSGAPMIWAWPSGEWATSILSLPAIHKRSSVRRKRRRRRTKDLRCAKSCCQITSKGNRFERHPHATRLRSRLEGQ
jgi:hypothetical protein